MLGAEAKNPDPSRFDEASGYGAEAAAAAIVFSIDLQNWLPRLTTAAVELSNFQGRGVAVQLSKFLSWIQGHTFFWRGGAAFPSTRGLPYHYCLLFFTCFCP